MTQAEIEQSLAQFEGLVFETARQTYESGVEMEFEDLRQLFRIKAWHATQKFCETRRAYTGQSGGRTALERYVFGCLRNLRRDIEKRTRRYDDSIDELRDATADCGESFDAKYLSVEHDDVYGEVEEQPFELPSTLTRVERSLVVLKMEGTLLMEIDRRLGLSRAQRERVLASVREKLADWDPHPAVAQRSAPMRPLPDAEPQRARVRAALAA